MLNSSNENTRQTGAGFACQAAFINDEAKDLSERALRGDASMRCGASYTYSRYMGNNHWGILCEKPLLELAYDDDDQVKRYVAMCFSYTRAHQLDNLRDFIRGFLLSPGFEVEQRYLVEFVRPLAVTEHELVLDITDRIIQTLLAGRGTGQRFDYDDVVSLPLAVYNRTSNPTLKERAITLFESLLALNIPSALKALKQWDEHRRFEM